MNCGTLHRQMTSFRQCEGAFLLKTPDLLLTDFDAPRSSAIVDIKIVDSSAAACYVNSQHHLQISSSRHTEPWRLPVPVTTLYFGPSRRPPPGARMRVVTFVVSTFGSLGAQAEAQALIKVIGSSADAPTSSCLFHLPMRHLGLPRPSPP